MCEAINQHTEREIDSICMFGRNTHTMFLARSNNTEYWLVQSWKLTILFDGVNVWNHMILTDHVMLRQNIKSFLNANFDNKFHLIVCTTSIKTYVYGRSNKLQLSLFESKNIIIRKMQYLYILYEESYYTSMKYTEGRYQSFSFGFQMLFLFGVLLTKSGSYMYIFDGKKI